MDSDIYFSLLSDRVQHLIDENDDSDDAMNYAFNVLEKSNLIYEEPNNEGQLYVR